MSTQDTRKYYDILELPPDAPFAEVRKKYLYLSAFYMGDSMELAALNGDAPYHRRQIILAELQDAYNKMKDILGREEPAQQPSESPKVSVSDSMKDYLNGITAYSGPILKEIREKMAIDLGGMANATKVQKRYLEEIEAEQFVRIPAEVYLRGYVIEYARYLSLDHQKVAEDYMKRYRKFRSSSEEKK
jgi:flagellar biosynthesis protein FlhG